MGLCNLGFSVCRWCFFYFLCALLCLLFLSFYGCIKIIVQRWCPIYTQNILQAFELLSVSQTTPPHTWMAGKCFPDNALGDIFFIIPERLTLCHLVVFATIRQVGLNGRDVTHTVPSKWTGFCWRCHSFLFLSSYNASVISCSCFPWLTFSIYVAQ